MKRINCFGIVCAIGMGWLTACGGMKDSTETPEQIPTSHYTVAREEEKEVSSGEKRRSEEAVTSKEVSEESRSSEPAETAEGMECTEAEEKAEFMESTEVTEDSEPIGTWELREATEHAVVLEQTEAEESESSPVAGKPVEPAQNPEESETNPAETTVPQEVKQPEHVHDFYESWWTYPDCVNGGYYFIRCRGCDYEETGMDAAKLAPLGHEPDEGVVVKAPTCQHAGVREHHCRVCGAALADSEIPADPTAHVWVEDDLGVYCDVCNQEG